MFKDIFIDLCVKRNEAPTNVVKKIGLSNAAFSCWNENTIPRRTTLLKIADYFGVSVDYLLGKDDKKENSIQENGTISIRSRDGSVIESELSDEQLELFKNMLKQFKGNR